MRGAEAKKGPSADASRQYDKGSLRVQDEEERKKKKNIKP